MNGFRTRFLRPQHGFRTEQQRAGGDVVVAGHNGNLPDLRMLLFQNIQGKHGILRGGAGLVLYDHMLRRDPVFRQPFRHPARLRHRLIFRSGAASRADNHRPGVLFSTVQNDLQALDQFIAHTAVRRQLKAQRHNGQLIRIREPIGQRIIVERQIRIGGAPQRHNALPARRGVRVRRLQLPQKLLYAPIRFRAVAAVIHHHLFDDFLIASARRFLRLAAANTQSEHQQRQHKSCHSPLPSVFHSILPLSVSSASVDRRVSYYLLILPLSRQIPSGRKTSPPDQKAETGKNTCA